MRTSEDNKVYMKQYYNANKEILLKRGKEYRENNKELIKERKKKYREVNSDILKERKREWYQNNKEKILAKRQQYYKDNKEIIADKRKDKYNQEKEIVLSKNKEYRDLNRDVINKQKRDYYHANKETIRENPSNRANGLLSSYKFNDKKYNREGFNITKQFILDHIFNSSCIYCDESDWHELGCDRIDNTKAHTTDNVVCACKSCNIKRGSTPFREFLLSQNPSGASEILSNLQLSPQEGSQLSSNSARQK